MKQIFKNIIAIFAIVISFSSLAKAESISQQELQQRFNKAFSIFHGKSSDFSQLSQNTKEEKSKETKEQPVSINSSENNIVKQTSEVKVEKRPLRAPQQLTLPSIPRSQFGESIILTELGERPISVDIQNDTLKSILQAALDQAAQKENWKIRWRLKDEHKYLLTERINITAEVDFDSFVGNMINSIANITGIKLSTKVFYKNRIIIITDTF